MAGRERAAWERRHLPQQGSFFGIDVGLTDALEPVFGLDDVQRAIIRYRGNRQTDQSCQCGLVVERGAEDATRLGK